MDSSKLLMKGKPLPPGHAEACQRGKRNMNRMRHQREDAESIAIRALGFLAGDDSHMERFLALTGIGPGDIRAAASEPGFLAAVLDHVASDESLLLAFAANAGLAPGAVATAKAALAGPGPDSDHQWP
jgi:hypothetical protein